MPVTAFLPFEDHPRGCGEHSLLLNALGFPKGSSPRMRGAPLPYVSSISSSRIIPADAGSTRCSQAVPIWTWDHPRGCGEHAEREDPGDSQTGSSPRMRGAQPGHLVPEGGWGIIPADAGSTGHGPGLAGLGGDHPRGCGEHSSRSSGR